MKRREFVNLSLGASAGLVLANCQFPSASEHASYKGKRLILIQMEGGHDGLFAISKLGINEIESRRPNLMAEFEKNCISLSDDWAMNQRLSSLKALIEKKELLFIPNVGYQSPNTSHFKAREFWDSGLLPKDTNAQNRMTGWLGRAYEEKRILSPQIEIPFLNLHNNRTLYDRGSNIKALAYTDSDYKEWYAPYYDDYYKSIDSDLKSYYKKIESFHSYRKEAYSGELGSQLKTAAQLIQQEIPIPVIHCTLAGFDTHSGELERLTDLYEDFSKSLSGLANDLTQSGHWDETLVFIYSDFGRTIDENASGGTDHGYSGLSMIAGGNLNKYKQYNKPYDPKFVEKRGELYLDFQVDFRDLIQDITAWLA